jgi:hypothetical protein
MLVYERFNHETSGRKHWYWQDTIDNIPTEYYFGADGNSIGEYGDSTLFFRAFREAEDDTEDNTEWNYLYECRALQQECEHLSWPMCCLIVRRLIARTCGRWHALRFIDSWVP